MICPSCRNLNSPKGVVRTDMLPDGRIKRRRRCSQCKELFWTIEDIWVKGGLNEVRDFANKLYGLKSKGTFSK